MYVMSSNNNIAPLQYIYSEALSALAIGLCISNVVISE